MSRQSRADGLAGSSSCAHGTRSSPARCDDAPVEQLDALGNVWWWPRTIVAPASANSRKASSRAGAGVSMNSRSAWTEYDEHVDSASRGAYRPAGRTVVVRVAGPGRGKGVVGVLGIGEEFPSRPSRWRCAYDARRLSCTDPDAGYTGVLDCPDRVEQTGGARIEDVVVGEIENVEPGDAQNRSWVEGCRKPPGLERCPWIVRRDADTLEIAEEDVCPRERRPDGIEHPVCASSFDSIEHGAGERDIADRAEDRGDPVSAGAHRATGDSTARSRQCLRAMRRTVTRNDVPRPRIRPAAYRAASARDGPTAVEVAASNAMRNLGGDVLTARDTTSRNGDPRRGHRPSRVGFRDVEVGRPRDLALHAMGAARARVLLREDRGPVRDSQRARRLSTPRDAARRDPRRRRTIRLRRPRGAGNRANRRATARARHGDGRRHGLGDLKRGPGRDRRTFMPGEGELVYIAGHRTTYGAPFAHIDRMRTGDRVVLEMPYAVAVYRVTPTRHRPLGRHRPPRERPESSWSHCRRAIRASPPGNATSSMHGSSASRRCTFHAIRRRSDRPSLPPAARTRRRGLVDRRLDLARASLARAGRHDRRRDTARELDLSRHIRGDAGRCHDRARGTRVGWPRHRCATGWRGGVRCASSLDRAALRAFGLAGNPDYLLVEFPYAGWPPDLATTLTDLLDVGITPVLAHPERNDEIQAAPHRLAPLVAEGVLVQLTASSLAGSKGRGSNRAARALIDGHLAHLIASDAHRPSARVCLGVGRPELVRRRPVGMAHDRRTVGDRPRRRPPTQQAGHPTSTIVSPSLTGRVTESGTVRTADARTGR